MDCSPKLSNLKQFRRMVMRSNIHLARDQIVNKRRSLIPGRRTTRCHWKLHQKFRYAIYRIAVDFLETFRILRIPRVWEPIRTAKWISFPESLLERESQISLRRLSWHCWVNVPQTRQGTGGTGWISVKHHAISSGFWWRYRRIEARISHSCSLVLGERQCRRRNRT